MEMKEAVSEMRRLVRWIILLLALAICTLLIAVLLLISVDRALTYQVSLINNQKVTSQNEAEGNQRIWSSQNIGKISKQVNDTALVPNLKSYSAAMDTSSQIRLSLGLFQSIFSLSPDRTDSISHELHENAYSSDNASKIDFAPQLLTTVDSFCGTTVTKSEKRHNITLDDILITVKTTEKYHESRLKLIAQTWYNLAANQTFFFSDAPLAPAPWSTPEGQLPPVSARLRVTDCPATHQRRALCCKMSWELDAFLESRAKWWCHFDDDNYVNVAALVQLLGCFDPRLPWYLGRPSIRAPLQILDRDDVTQRITFWFATGGAGFCVSRALGLQMMPLAGGGKLISVGDKIRLPDDVTVGYVIEHLLGHHLTVLEVFHSHLESMAALDGRTLQRQVSLSYSTGLGSTRDNLLALPALHPKLDPTRMLSLHCMLQPRASYCPL